MTVPEFVAWAQGYYGPYPSGQRADVADYLRQFSAPELDEWKEQLKASCPSHIGQVNGYPPDIATMEAMRGKVCRAYEGKLRQIREKELERMLLPPPGEVSSSGEMMALDWSVILRHAIRRGGYDGQ